MHSETIFRISMQFMIIFGKLRSKIAFSVSLPFKKKRCKLVPIANLDTFTFFHFFVDGKEQIMSIQYATLCVSASPLKPVAVSDNQTNLKDPGNNEYPYNLMCRRI